VQQVSITTLITAGGLLIGVIAGSTSTFIVANRTERNNIAIEILKSNQSLKLICDKIDILVSTNLVSKDISQTGPVGLTAKCENGPPK
jgi:hypothetical protein